MSSLLTPRISRGKPPKVKLTPRNCRKKALAYLIRDFQSRCAYSMQHLQLLGGLKCMEVEHHDPRKKHLKIQEYENLFLATRLCNGSKLAKWPTEEQERKGIRFLNPCKEQDYGVHIVEDPISHELKGVTIAGRYHMITCDLNAPHLVRERCLRAEYRDTLQKANKPFEILKDNTGEAILRAFKQIKDLKDLMIPDIPAEPIQ